MKKIVPKLRSKGFKKENLSINESIDKLKFEIFSKIKNIYLKLKIIKMQYIPT